MRFKIQKSKLAMFLLFVFMLVLGSVFVRPEPPTPHGVSGYILYTNQNSQVPLGTQFYFNNTNNSFFMQSRTSVPVPGYTGYYSISINVTNGDVGVVRAWNKTVYGETWIILNGDLKNVNVTLNLSRPSETNVTITSPLNNAVLNSSYTFYLHANISVLGSNGQNCEATIIFDNSKLTLVDSDQTHNIGTINLGQVYTTSWQLNMTAIGKTNITVISNCSTDGINLENKSSYTVYNISLVDTTPPIVWLISPENNSWSNARYDAKNTTFYYNVSDLSPISNCSLFLDNAKNSTNAIISTNIQQNFSIEIADGNHTWFVQCIDNSTYANSANSTTRTVLVDKTPPEINLINPSNYDVKQKNFVLLEFTVNDTMGNVTNCSLVLNGAINETKTDVPKEFTQNFSRLFERNNYTWAIQCYDALANVNTSQTWFFNVTDPDFFVSDTNLSYSPMNPVEGNIITVFAVVSNIGDENATNVIVQFYENTTEAANQIGSDIILNLSASESSIINVTWVARAGVNTLIVQMDPPLETSGTYLEINESNNNASLIMLVPLWHVFYGNVSGGIKLSDGQNFYKYSWSVDKPTNIFAIETGTEVDWSNLQALGRTVTNSTAENDFFEADLALGTAGAYSSINDTFTANNAPRSTTNFTVYNLVINDVPYINSTNSSNFLTGIFWDTADGNTEYNGSQDLVFGAKVNRQAQGKYGVYDYEINVPTHLNEYKLGAGTISIYAELS